MKKIFFLFSLMILSFMAIGQVTPAKSAIPEPAIESVQVVVVDSATHDTTFVGTLEQIIQQLTQNPDAHLVLPAPINPTSTESLMSYWVLLYGLFMPILSFLFHTVWPSARKRGLIIKSTVFAVMVLLIVLNWQGYSPANVLQAVIAFILQVVSYDKLYNPMGLKSPRKRNYKAE